MLHLSNRTQPRKLCNRIQSLKNLAQPIYMQHVRQDPRPAKSPWVPCDIFFINVVVLLALELKLY